MTATVVWDLSVATIFLALADAVDLVLVAQLVAAWLITWAIGTGLGRLLDARDERERERRLRVAALFLGDPGKRWYALDLMVTPGAESGSLYVLLYRWERAGYLDSAQEPFPPNTRRPRRQYWVTTLGQQVLPELTGVEHVEAGDAA